MSYQKIVGIDLSSEKLSVAIHQSEAIEIANNETGFEELIAWLLQQRIIPSESLICMEATGVYGESLCYYLSHQGYTIAVEPPSHIARVSGNTLHKNDRLDAQKIAEYAHRFQDRLHLWKPHEEIVEQIKALLSTREQLTKQLTAQQNALKAIQRKHYRSKVSESAYETLMSHFKEQIKRMDQTIKDFIQQHPTINNTMKLLLSVPGVGLLFASHMLVHTDGFQKPLNPKQLAAYVGICPYERQSGTSLNKKPRSAGFGQPVLRKLLYLAAMSLKQHRKNFTHYFERKVAEGKPKHLILNNIANKLLKIMSAVLRTQKPYIENYVSLKPC